MPPMAQLAALKPVFAEKQVDRSVTACGLVGDG
jgi:hypothetical protein